MTDNSITVIGSGATALAAAAYLTIKGKQVILCDREQGQRFRDIEDGGGITLEGVMETGSPVLPFRMTDDFQDAVGNARRILVCVSADRHREIADLCSPYAREGQTYVISPGNLGAVIFVDRFYKKGKKGVTAAELVENICPCRITGRARVLMAMPVGEKRIAAFPACRTQMAIQAFEDVFRFHAARNIFEGMLNSPNLVIHVAGTLLNTTAIEKMGQDFALYTNGLTPSLLRCADAVEKERNQVLRELDYSAYASTVSKMHQMMDYGHYDELNYFRSLKGPASLEERYISEDASCSMALLVSLAEEYGIEVPVCKALITIANTVNGFNYYEHGRTLKNMGMSGMSRENLNQYLETLTMAGG